MGAVIMKKEEQKIYNLAIEVLHDRLTLVEFSLLSGKSYRQAQRIVKKVQNKNMLGVKHGNLGKVAPNKTDEDIKKFVIQLYKSKFYDFNVIHFREKLIAEEGITIGRETLRKWAREVGITKFSKRRCNKRVHKPRPRMPRRGMLIQFDGSEHDWFSGLGPRCTLLGGIDDATGEVISLDFFDSENLWSCLKALRDLVVEHGAPDAFYLDQGACFGKIYRDQSHTQVGRAIEELNTKAILATTPQAKGKIERLWKTLQDRLVPELRIRKISNMDDANKFLKEFYIKEHNTKYSIPPREKESNFRKIFSLEQIEDIFCIKEDRKIGPGNVFNFEMDKFIINENRNLRFRTIYIRQHIDKTYSYEVYGKKVLVTQYFGKNNDKFLSRLEKQAS